MINNWGFEYNVLEIFVITSNYTMKSIYELDINFVRISQEIKETYFLIAPLGSSNVFYVILSLAVIGVDSFLRIIFSMIKI